MTSKCSICRLPMQTLAAVDALLRENVPLKVISERTGLAITTLWRHGRHSVKAEGAAVPPKAIPKAKTVVPAPPKAARPVKTAVRPSKTPPLAPVEPSLPVPASKASALESPIDTESSRQRAQARTERLWSEVEQCLALAREPMVVVKPDGSELQVPIDLRTRSSVVRAGKEIVDLDAKLNGLYDAPPATQNFATVVFDRVILLPKLPSAELPMKAAPKTVDALPEPAPLPDGGAVDGEK